MVPMQRCSDTGLSFVFVALERNPLASSVMACSVIPRIRQSPACLPTILSSLLLYFLYQAADRVLYN